MDGFTFEKTMKIIRLIFPILFVLCFCAPGFAQQGSGTAHTSTLTLSEGWAIQSSVKVEEKGEVISTPSFQPREWMRANVPTTVVGAQLKNKLLPDPFFGMNLRQYPGLSYPIGANFSNFPMPPDSPYAVSWWYRKEFTLPKEYAGKTTWLNFRGINYRANLWLNGKQIANSNEVAGAWRTY